MDNQGIRDEQIRVPWQESIAARLSRVTIIAVVAAMVTLGAGLIWIARNAQLEGTAGSIIKSADQVALLVSSYVRHAEDDIRLFLDTRRLSSMSQAEQKASLEAMLISRSPEFSQITLIDKDGSEKVRVSRFHSFLPHELGSQADNPVFLAAREGTAFLSSIFVSPDSGMLSLQMAMPSDAERRGPILLADVNMSRLWQEVSLTEIGRTGYAYLVDVHGRFVAFQEPSTVLKRYGEDMSRMPPVAAFMSGDRIKAPHVRVYHGLSGESVIGLFRPIAGTDWAVIVEMPTKEAYAGVTKMQWYLLGLTLLGAFTAGILVFLASRRLIRPISALTTAAQRMGTKDWDIDVAEVRSNDEVSILGQVFSRMRHELRDLYENIEEQVQELRQSKEKLEKSESRYRFLTEKMNDVIWTMDLDLKLTYVSPSVQRILGFSVEEHMKRDMEETMTPESFSRALDLISSELERDGLDGVDPDRKIMTEFQYYCKNGGMVWLESVISAIRDKDGSIIGIHGVSRDITERKHAEEEKRRLEDQLAHARKMESIGTMAGGIAHDFNNLLSAIFGHAELALEDLSNHNKLSRHLKEVLRAGARARDLVRQILAFSRRAEKMYVPLELCTVVKESLKLMRSIIPTTIEIRQELLDKGRVMSDPTQINQIMMNLCTNAAHAMDEGGGLLLVGLKKVVLDDQEAHSLELAPGHYMRMTISDTGQGMTPEVMDRIFDPYFTTKGLGEGTGLGLSVVHGIVKSHGGAVTCRSKPGEGTIFHVYLPELESPVEIVETQGQETCARGNERILFVDDEPSLASLAEEMLSNLGYRMTASTMPAEALELLANDPHAFDLVITDMTMPGMRGDQLARKIMEIRRDMPIILCTGFSEHINEKKALEMGIRAYVLKPLQMNAMSDTIRKVLDEQLH